MTKVLPLLVLSCFSITFACTPGGILAGDGEVIIDPEFLFTVSPPVGWTFFPNLAAGAVVQTIQTVNYFPGQGLSLNNAMQRATADITGSVLEAFNEAAIAAPGIEITVVYEPDMISNCFIGSLIPAGTRIGVLSGGAITEVAAVPSNGVTLQSCTPVVGLEFEEYVKDVRVVIRGFAATRYVWNRIAAGMLASLNFRYNALFRSPIIITR